MPKPSQFSAFSPDALSFLSDLKANNSRDWFHANKKTYEGTLKQTAKEFCLAFSERLLELTGYEHETKIFRINRDIRFSKDKTPYNAQLRISFLPLISAQIKPAWYFSLEPDQVVFGTGVFMLDKAPLEAMRARIAGDEGQKLKRLLLDMENSAVRLSNPELKRVPKPYGKDHANAELLRHKSLSAWVDFSDPFMATRPNFIDQLMNAATSVQPLFDWLENSK